MSGASFARPDQREGRALSETILVCLTAPRALGRLHSILNYATTAISDIWQLLPVGLIGITIAVVAHDIPFPGCNATNFYFPAFGIE